MGNGHLDDAAHWRSRAAEARLLAAQITDAKAKAMMLDTALGYEKIAQHAEMRAAEANKQADIDAKAHQAPAQAVSLPTPRQFLGRARRGLDEPGEKGSA
jgi:hypothetical protein